MNINPMQLAPDPEMDGDVIPDRVDKRDAPGPSPEALELYPDAGEEQREAEPAQVVPVRIVRPMPSRPAPGRLLYAFTREMAAGAGPILLGLEPSVAQTQGVHSLLLTTDQAVDVASHEDATPSSRYRPGVVSGLQFDGVAGLYVWNATAETATISVAVLGSFR